MKLFTDSHLYLARHARAAAAVAFARDIPREQILRFRVWETTDIAVFVVATPHGEVVGFDYNRALNHDEPGGGLDTDQGIVSAEGLGTAGRVRILPDDVNMEALGFRFEIPIGPSIGVFRTIRLELQLSPPLVPNAVRLRYGGCKPDTSRGLLEKVAKNYAKSVIEGASLIFGPPWERVN